MDPKSLLRPWLQEQVVLESAQSPRELLEQLVPAVVPTARGQSGYPFGQKDSFILVGRVSSDDISVMASRGFSRNIWRPTLSGSMQESESGTRFTGTLGMPSWVFTVSAVMLTVVAAFVAFAIAAGWRSAVGGGIAVTLVVLFTMVAGAFAGAKERGLLLTWITGVLGPEPTSR